MWHVHGCAPAGALGILGAMRSALLVLAVLATSAFAADSEPTTVIEAEYAFAAAAKPLGVRGAFLKYLAPDSILCSPMPVNGIVSTAAGEPNRGYARVVSDAIGDCGESGHGVHHRSVDLSNRRRQERSARHVPLRVAQAAGRKLAGRARLRRLPCETRIGRERSGKGQRPARNPAAKRRAGKIPSQQRTRGSLHLRQRHRATR